MSKNVQLLKQRRNTATLRAVFTKTGQIFTVLVFLISMVGQPARIAKAATPVSTPVVAIHVSEATDACWSSLGGPHNDWKYWHIYGFLMEALNSDGTPYVVVSDADIAGGTLLNGAEPKYPILISLAAACISDATTNEIREFVEAGGHVYVGSTSWTRVESLENNCLQIH